MNRVPGVLKVLGVLGVLSSACNRAPEPAAQQTAPAARPTTAAKEDWSLYSKKPNPQEVLVLDKDSLAATHTDWPLVVAQIKEFRREGSALRVRFVLRNEGVETQRPLFLYKDVHLVDRDSGAKYDLLKSTDGGWDATPGNDKTNPEAYVVELDPGQDSTVVLRFAAPPEGVTSAGLEIPDVAPLDRVAIQK